jgi:hypothetical protein
MMVPLAEQLGRRTLYPQSGTVREQEVSDAGAEPDDLADYGLDLPTLRIMYAEWESGGISKSAVERRYIGKSTHHGKLFTKLVRRHLGIETERRAPLAQEVMRLRALLVEHGIDPDSPPKSLFEGED